MSNQIVINANPFESRVALLENDHVVEIFIERSTARGLLGNIYKASITRVLPGMQSAFVDIGEERNGFLYINDVYNEDFVAKSRKLLEEVNEDLTPDEIAKRIKWVKVAIEKILREGQQILVQVIKEPFNNKGARLTMFLTIPGRFLVVAPFFSHVGISKKIVDEKERSRLREIMLAHKPDDMSVIVRTAAQGVEASILSAELEYLLETWQAIMKESKETSAPAILHQDLDLASRVVRDTYSDDMAKIVLDDTQTFSKLKKFMDANIPEALPKLELYAGQTPIFDVYGVEVDIGRALSRKIALPSGGYVIVDQTEALTAFDVNTGRYVGRKSARETVLKTNMESISKIAGHLRLCNIGGIIIIDFIDMEDPADRERVSNALIEELKADKAKTNVLKMSELGLVQMTRKRTSESLEHLLLDECPLCDGRGHIKSLVTEAHDLLREIVRVHLQSKVTTLNILAREDICSFILGPERPWFDEIVKQFALTIHFKQGELTPSALKASAFEVSPAN